MPDPTAAEQAREAVLRRDRDLLRRWREGDAQAGLTLLDHYRGLFHRTCTRLRITDDDQIADLWQQVVLELVERLPDLDGRIERSFAGYLCWRVRGAVDKLRARAPRATEDSAVVEVAAPPVGHEQWDAIEHCSDRLPARERAVFRLRFVMGMSLKETAASLDSNVNAVSQSVFRLVRRMQECLRKAGY